MAPTARKSTVQATDPGLPPLHPDRSDLQLSRPPVQPPRHRTPNNKTRQPAGAFSNNSVVFTIASLRSASADLRHARPPAPVVSYRAAVEAREEAIVETAKQQHPADGYHMVTALVRRALGCPVNRKQELSDLKPTVPAMATRHVTRSPVSGTSRSLVIGASSGMRRCCLGTPVLWS
jgi:hypothetical protein